ncbi:MAG: mannose-1-phosphate guanylyltransferase/mannose-6-phosphate isomerase [Desulfobacteraceae bacterium]|nr:mannose-1-phosphate guanylyltransferase/mannose-6-phosphate isomerase [Desulfobacteraceae bacterium]MBC2754960.1 mannose-1-phosphate guanylyltransferase/mannose-6-phosphate isomerase [Desulfobacteraceae bacterium]
MIIPVVLAGGSGTRLWPISRELYPKQLLNLTDEHTMIQNTLLRLNDFEGMALPVIIGSDKQRFIVDQQLAEVNIRPSEIFLEPVGRNTAPAVAVAALKAVTMDPESLILVLPADHLIGDVPKFHEALRTAERFAEQGFLVTFGIVPDRPETGYGYIRQGEPAQALIGDSSNGLNKAYAIYEFVEKPDLPTARHYLATGDYCWNSGMFMFKAARVLEELKRFVPDIVNACEKAFKNGHSDQGCFYLEQDAFSQCPSDSIDYAVMEKTERGIMVPLDAGWDDLGSWEALWNVGDKDESGNVISGDVICVDVEGSLVNAQSRLVTVLGVKNLSVVETPDAVLVSSLSNTQGVKKIVETLKVNHRKEVQAHKKIIQSWGFIETVDAGENFQVRKVTVFPQASFYLKNHSYTAVNWMILEGEARLNIDAKSVELSTHQSFSFEAGKSIKLANAKQTPLVFIEVAAGSQTGTDHLDVNL